LVILILLVLVSFRFPAVCAYLYFRFLTLRFVDVFRRFLLLALRVLFLRRDTTVATVPTIRPPATAPPIAVATGFPESFSMLLSRSLIPLVMPPVKLAIDLFLLRLYISLLVKHVHAHVPLSRRASPFSGFASSNDLRTLHFPAKYLGLRS